MAELRFLLICEGSSDGALVDHIERLLIHCGATGAVGSSFHFGRYLRDKIRHGVRSSGVTDLLFIHRDADGDGLEARHSEIASEVSAAEYHGPWIGVVPVRMLEAWLLGDEAAIRRVAGRPRGTAPLQVPRAAALEGIADPKTALREALIRAGGPSGVRRRKKFNAAIPGFRRQLVENLPIGGALEQLPAWVRFRDSVASVVSTWQER